MYLQSPAPVREPQKCPTVSMVAPVRPREEMHQVPGVNSRHVPIVVNTSFPFRMSALVALDKGHHGCFCLPRLDTLQFFEENGRTPICNGLGNPCGPV